MGNQLPRASTHRPSDRLDRIRRVIEERRLVGLANDTKWDELLRVMRGRSGWVPSYRWACVDAGGYASEWDTEWHYHLPFPFVSVEWFDIGLIQRIHRGRPLDAGQIDHGPWIEATLTEIGFDHERHGDLVRIYGYAPRSLDKLVEAG